MEKLDTLGEGDVLFLAGSIPFSMPDDMYEQIMARLDGKGVMIVVDATKDLLVNVLKYHPFLVKPNNHELGEIFGVELKTREDVIPYGKKLQEKAGRGLYVALFLFVGIPLPGTGAWTGTLAASLLDMDFKKSTLAVMCGVVLAGIIMGLVSGGVFSFIR